MRRKRWHHWPYCRYCVLSQCNIGHIHESLRDYVSVCMYVRVAEGDVSSCVCLFEKENEYSSMERSQRASAVSHNGQASTLSLAPVTSVIDIDSDLYKVN